MNKTVYKKGNINHSVTFFDPEKNLSSLKRIQIKITMR